MIDSFDYKEPSCVLCEGKNFYNPDISLPDGFIPVKRIIEKVDDFFNKNDYESAGKLLEYWKNEAISLKDKKGELSINDELIGFYRKINNKELAYKAIARVIELIEQLNVSETVSSATVYLNVATGYKAFGDYEKAIFYYEKTLKIYKEKLNANDQMFAGLYNNYALALSDAKMFDDAEKMFFDALNVFNDNECVDKAITYVNLAHLYENNLSDPKQKITNCLFSAYNILSSEKIIDDGYTAFVFTKCAPSFGYFGYNKIEKELKDKSEIIYERNRNS